jgi:hypothetical protein
VGIPNTDPRSTPTATLHATRHVRFAPAGATPTQADAWSAGVATPLTTTASAYTP